VPNIGGFYGTNQYT